MNDDQADGHDGHDVLEPLEPRLRAYLRSRGAVEIPSDLGELAFERVAADGPRPRLALGRWGAVAGIAAVLILAAVSFALGSRPNIPVEGSPSPSPVAQRSPEATSSASPDSTGTPLPSTGVFPATVLGMPVVTIAEARTLLNEGRLDGRVVAVSGYFSEFYPSCPAPRGYQALLEQWCRMVGFADDAKFAQLCERNGENGINCSGMGSGGALSPFLMVESIGDDHLRTNVDFEPIPVVFVGHTSDPRAWHCLDVTACSLKLVVDRVAWVHGEDVPAQAPETGDNETGTLLTPKMTLDEAASAAGISEELVTGAVFQARDIASVDPRLNLAGEGLVWMLRSRGGDSTMRDPADQTRSGLVSLVDDSTGRVVATRDLASAEGYRPARLWVQATRPTRDGNAPDDMYPFFRIQPETGDTVQERRVSGGLTGSMRLLTYGPDIPVLLDGGTYTVSWWLAGIGEDTTAPTLACSMEAILAPGDDVTAQAAFTFKDACTTATLPAPTPEDGL
jgi:hypothetical protein